MIKSHFFLHLLINSINNRGNDIQIFIRIFLIDHHSQHINILFIHLHLHLNINFINVLLFIIKRLIFCLLHLLLKTLFLLNINVWIVIKLIRLFCQCHALRCQSLYLSQQWAHISVLGQFMLPKSFALFTLYVYIHNYLELIGLASDHHVLT